MARNRQRKSRRVGVRSSDAAVTTGVFAPSGERARSPAADAASALSQAFGLAGDIAGAEMQRRNVEGFEQAQTDYARGDIDAENENAGYLKAVDQLRARRQFQEDAIAWDEYKRENFDPENSDDPVGDLNGLLDQFYSRYAGASAAEAEVLLPRMEQLRAAELAALQQTMRENADIEIMAGLAATVDDFHTANGEFNHQGFIEVVKDVRNGADIWTSYVDALTTRATELVNSGDLEAAYDAAALLDVPEKLDGRGLPPKHRAAIEATAVQVDKAIREVEQKKLAGARVQTYVGLNALAEQGTLTFQRGLPALEADLITEDEFESLLIKNWNTQHSGEMAVSYASYVRDGKGALIPSKHQQSAMTEYLMSDEITDEERRAAAIERGTTNGIMWQPHKQIMEQASPLNPEMFEEGFALYKEYEANAPRFLYSEIPDWKQAQYTAYESLRGAGQSHEQALESLRDYDEDRAMSLVDGAKFNDLLATAVADVQDIPWSLSEVRDSVHLREGVRDMASTLLGLGVYTPEEAVKLAVDRLGKTRVDVEGDLYHVNSGWPANAQDAADWFKAQVIPEGEDPDDWRLAKDWSTKDTGDVVLIPEGEIPFGPHWQKFSIDDITSRWATHSAEVEHTEAIAAKKEQMEDAWDEAVLNITSPYGPYFGAGNLPDPLQDASVASRFGETRREWFMRLPREEQEVMVSNEIDRMNTEDDKRKAARATHKRKLAEIRQQFPMRN